MGCAFSLGAFGMPSRPSAVRKIFCWIPCRHSRPGVNLQEIYGSSTAQNEHLLLPEGSELGRIKITPTSGGVARSAPDVRASRAGRERAPEHGHERRPVSFAAPFAARLFVVGAIFFA